MQSLCSLAPGDWADQNLQQEFSIVFLFYKMLYMTKKFLKKDQVKTFYENLLSLKPAKLLLRKIKKLSDKWQDMIQNSHKYPIDWNQFIVKLFMNELQFSKMEIIDDLPYMHTHTRARANTHTHTHTHTNGSPHTYLYTSLSPSLSLYIYIYIYI